MSAHMHTHHKSVNILFIFSCEKIHKVFQSPQHTKSTQKVQASVAINTCHKRWAAIHTCHKRWRTFQGSSNPTGSFRCPQLGRVSFLPREGLTASGPEKKGLARIFYKGRDPNRGTQGSHSLRLESEYHPNTTRVNQWHRSNTQEQAVGSTRMEHWPGGDALVSVL